MTTTSAPSTRPTSPLVDALTRAGLEHVAFPPGHVTTEAVVTCPPGVYVIRTHDDGTYCLTYRNPPGADVHLRGAEPSPARVVGVILDHHDGLPV